jgi:lipopolysaccharide/colanic/teichoic acid biosynthesis glycosyltransferase
MAVDVGGGLLSSVSSVPVRSHVDRFGARPARSTSGRRVRTSEALAPRILGETLFKRALAREQRRAERGEVSLPLLFVSTHGSPAADLDWGRALEAVRAAIRETDIVGWVQYQSVIGVILTEAHSADVAFPVQMEARVRQQLALRFDIKVASRFAVGFVSHPDFRVAGPKALIDRSIAQLENTPREATWTDAVKRGLDIAGSAALLTALSPVFVATAAAIKLKSPGPVFFKQQRIGQNAQPFTMLKFRTMHVNNQDAIHKAYMSQFIKANGTNGAAGGNGAVQKASTETPFKITNDPRVTSIGHFLRKTSIDELPQLINVLLGDMSLVGPRPPIQYEVDQYQRWHRRRVLEAKPGITGLWQVTGRSRTTFNDMVRLDLRYAKKRSLWTDLKILLATPRAVFAGKGAC